LLPVARDCMAPSYPELAAEFQRISDYAYVEEDSFLTTLKAGTTILDTAITDTKSAGGKQLSGSQTFQLHDTYGFPIDLTLEIAQEQGLDIDHDGFRRLMAEQRTRAKADAKARKTGHADLSAYRTALDAGGPVEFTGYQEVSRESRVRALIGSGGDVKVAGEGDYVKLVLDTTPFYAEGGGQQSDTGVIRVGDGELEVVDVQRPLPGPIVHSARVLRGEVRAGEAGYAEIDVTRRRAISRSHTATHLIHQTMRHFLGESATQAARSTRPAGCASTSKPPGPSRPWCSTTWSGRSTRSFYKTLRFTRSSPPSGKRAGSARWRCSARSTATRSGSSRSATTPVSCAPAPTCPAPGNSAWSRH
jgi:alanyl-tRNA synthetase